ncbi:hypothetical protein LPJ63_001658 [Coemansia sp. RSA 2711]|nr:hypothetical protein LPJ63_001658 [Coemansia sp. RSA 2711]KAJ2297229.1 hypothetical protein IWW54_006815 [Coemansia sp. RSA 2705]KAJ2303907.1 hypothetical protein IWW52_006697 [Coemansia sp. RSA 2704]KAJ2359823.1 hypothetical protein H4S01_005995 [Coemansia sp. RSA 2610]KAJ2391902.1 hypothetical protein H4S02_001083 [Coemansia sp. RSA 2611]KAJ2710312.1 hypothetical protein H4R23_006612 [Coemansia sp. Cherry 401B]
MSGIGPQIPPEIAAKLGIRTGGSEPAEERSQIGPTMPPAATASSPKDVENNEDSDSGDDSDAIGPSVSLAGYSAEQAQQQTLGKLDAQMERSQPDKSADTNGRGEWMLVPPSAKTAKQAKDAALFDESWTLTPEQRREKREKEREKEREKRRQKQQAPGVQNQQQDAEQAQWVDDYNRALRPKSLMEMHAESKKKKKDKKGKRAHGDGEDDDWKRQRFDRDRDLASTKRKGDGRQKAAVMDAIGALADKYAPGKGGSFL